MARTKADAYVKASVKSTRKSSVLSPSSSSGSPRRGKSDKYAGGNPYCPRPTPSWQKPITSFYPTSTIGSSNDTQMLDQSDLKTYTKKIASVPCAGKDEDS